MKPTPEPTYLTDAEMTDYVAAPGFARKCDEHLHHEPSRAVARQLAARRRAIETRCDAILPPAVTPL